MGMEEIEIVKLVLPLVQAMICLMAGVVILQLRVQFRRNPLLPPEHALRFLLAAIGAWLFLAIIDVTSALIGWTGNSLDIMRSFISGINDLFLILAVTQLDFSPSWIKSYRIRMWPFLLLAISFVSQILLLLLAAKTIPFFSDAIRTWEIPGVLVSLTTGLLMIIGFNNSFRGYNFAFPWLGIGIPFLAAWIIVQPLYLLQSLDGSIWLRLVSTAGLMVFVLSTMTLLLAWISHLVAQARVDTLFASSSDNIAVSPIGRSPEALCSVVGSENRNVLEKEGEIIFSNRVQEIREQSGGANLVAINVSNGSWVFGRDMLELASRIAHEQDLRKDRGCYYTRRLSERALGEN